MTGHSRFTTDYPANTNICITFIQRLPNVFDVGPTLYKCYTNVLRLLPRSVFCDPDDEAVCAHVGALITLFSHQPRAVLYDIYKYPLFTQITGS